MGEGVWIIEEHDQDNTQRITLELINEGRQLARRLNEPLCLCVIGATVSALIPQLSCYGVERIYVIAHDALAGYTVDPYSRLLAALIRKYTPSVVMMGATPMGAELAPQVAAKLKIPCVTDIKKIVGSRQGFKITKSVYSDQAYAHIHLATNGPLIVTIAPGETDAERLQKHQSAEIIEADVDPPSLTARTRNSRFLKGDPRTIRIAEADRIVAGGRGAGESGFQILQEFADILGAAMAGSRAAVDDGHLSANRQIGISGNSVTPKLLVAGAISGAREFTIGMENAELIIAINTDGKARIFEFANLCIKGDVKRVIPAAIKRLKTR
ncbi:MAG: electron transfer flavoprotein subunit alpha/FixB family protein [Desulfobacterales bacterium]|nr:electron transfer flavoprotein subunit alpha/FixB family protein [Desulfobacterales bacterium]